MTQKTFIDTINTEYDCILEKQNQHSERFVYNEIFDSASKLYFKEASGPYITGADGTLYIDFAMGGGVNLLGHSPAVVTRVLSDCANGNELFIAQPHKVGELFAQKFCEILPHLGGVIFSNSGSEATLRAIRLARAYTGKMKFAMFSGGWHGTHDSVLVGEDYSNSHETAPTPMLLSAGIPEEILDQCILLPYNEDEAFSLIENNSDELACVLIEPIQGSNPRDGIKPFLQKLRTVTSRNNILLCFDEIITGFRLAVGGAQELFAIEADIAVYGKSVGGGLPLALTAAKKGILESVQGKTYMGGTFSGNILCSKIALSILEYLQEHKNSLYSFLNEEGQWLREYINKACIDSDIPVRIYGEQSMSRLIFTDIYIKNRRERDMFEIDQDIQKLFYKSLAVKGVFVPSNRIIFISAAHTRQILHEAADAIINTLHEFKEYGLLNSQDLELSEINPNDKQL